jgi:CheY-like chemotaxis protein
MADILIVEDDAELAATLAELLTLEGHTTRIALDGREGLQAMEEHLPDLILLDIEMPVLDGPGMAYAALVRDAGSELIPIILSSGYADLDAVATRVGTPYRIPKPCSLSALLKLVDRALTERQAPHPLPRTPAASEERHG